MPRSYKTRQKKYSDCSFNSFQLNARGDALKSGVFLGPGIRADLSQVRGVM